MISEVKEWVAIAVVGVAAIGSWFTLKGDVNMLKSQVEDLESREHPVVDLTQVATNTQAIQRLERANERSDEQRTHLLQIIERMRADAEKGADKQDKFHTEMIKQITQIQERTKALQS